jgi:uncharacterized membrane protein
MLTTARIISAAIVGGVVAGPIWGALGSDTPLAFSSTVFAAFCHQDPDRSWGLLGSQLPVCIRCLGFYLGGFTTCIFALRFDKSRFYAAVALALAGLALEQALGTVSAEVIRFSTALLLAGLTLPALWAHAKLSSRCEEPTAA